MIGTPLCSVTLGHDYDMHFCILVASKKRGVVVRRGPSSALDPCLRCDSPHHWVVHCPQSPGVSHSGNAGGD